MASVQTLTARTELTPEQKREGYWVEEAAGSVLVWHNQVQVALFYASLDIGRKVQEAVERRRAELREIEARFGRP